MKPGAGGFLLRAPHRSTWQGVLVVGALVLGGLAACGDDDEAPITTTTTTEASSTTSSTSTTTTAAPARSEDAAISAWIEARPGGPYLGPCPVDFDPEFPLEGLCSVQLSADGDQSIRGIGPPFSEILAYLLLEGGEDGWAVVDTYAPADPYDLSDAPDWVPHAPSQ